MRTGRLLVGLAALASVFLMPPRTAMGSAVLTVELERAQSQAWSSRNATTAR